jgi:RND family efflux transporter MFP subunit
LARKAFSESEGLEFEEVTAEDVTSDWQERQSHRWLSGLSGIALGIGLGIAIAAGGMRFLSHSAKPPKAPVQQSQGMSVTVVPVESSIIARSLNVTGTVAARDLLPVLPEATDLKIKQILVEENSVVRAGQVMAVLDESVLQTQLEQAQAQLESSRAVVGQREAVLAQSRATLADAQKTLQRYQQLASQGAISTQDRDTRATTAATAREAVHVAEANITSARADVRNNAARVEQLRTQIGQTLVRAPAAGIVAEKIARIGDVTNSTQKLFSIIRDGVVELQAAVDANKELPQVRIGAPVEIKSDNDGRLHLQGRVREIAPLVDPQSRKATVKIDLPKTSLLRPGVFVRAEIATNTVMGLTLPAQAVQARTSDDSIVFLLTEDKVGDKRVRAQPVKVGEIFKGNRVEIKGGLKVGDRVVVTGAGYLHDGDRVRPQPAMAIDSFR